MSREDSKALISVLAVLALACLCFAGIGSAQSFTFDGSGRLKVNASGSSNVLVSVTNSISTSVGNTVALPVTNASANPLWVTLTNSTANAGNHGVTNSVGTYLWTALTNSPSVTVLNSNAFQVSQGGVGNWSADAATIGGVAPAFNSGASGATVLRVIPANNTTVSATNFVNLGTNIGGTYIWTSQTNSIPAGSAVIGAVTQSGTWNNGVTNSVGTYLWAGITNNVTIGNSNTFGVTQNQIGSNNIVQVGGQAIGTGGVPVTNGASTFNVTVSNTNAFQTGQHNVAVIATNVNGYTPYYVVSAGTVNTNTIKGSAGTLGYCSAFNSNSAPRYVIFMDSATNRSTAFGETTGQKFMIPGNTAGAGYVCPLPPQGLKFNNGICYGIVGGMATNDATAINANECILNIGYN